MEQESPESVIDSGKTRAGGRRSMIERAGGGREGPGSRCWTISSGAYICSDVLRKGPSAQ